MTKDELGELVVRSLGEWSSHSGTVLYSDIASIREAPFYLMGINPGGQDDGNDASTGISSSLCASDGTNSFTDPPWGKRYEPFQARVRDLIGMTGIQPKNMPSTNLIFARSSQIRKLPHKKDWLRRCWTVHQALLRLVEPSWIITLGAETFEGIRRCGEELQVQEPVNGKAGPVAWRRQMRLELGAGAKHDVSVLCVTHPSDLGFNVAKLGSAIAYPNELRQFIETLPH